jgi:ATP-dependent exoDNAse (exonuclease V) alpha subunit
VKSVDASNNRLTVELKAANRKLGTVQRIDPGGRLSLKMDGGRQIQLDPWLNPHLDHGYAVTSHSSQGQTADRVLIHVDTELVAKDLLNSRLAYVGVSRGAHDAQLFTNDRENSARPYEAPVDHPSPRANHCSR